MDGMFVLVEVWEIIFRCWVNKTRRDNNDELEENR